MTRVLLKHWRTMLPALALAWVIPAVAQAQETADVAKVIVPFVQKHCVTCHGAEQPKAGLSLHAFTDAQAILKERKLWDVALHLIESGEMPPKKRPQPTSDETAVLAKSVRAIYAKADAGKPDPGRVLIRRLNRTEYGNTVRDLLQLDLDFRPELELPTDAITHGFENNAEALTISPVLLDRYLASAEMIAERAIRVEFPKRELLKEQLNKNVISSAGGQYRLIDSGADKPGFTGPFYVTNEGNNVGREPLLKFASSDEFLFRVTLFIEKSSEPVRVALFVGGPGLPEYSNADEIGQILGGIPGRDSHTIKILKVAEVTSRSLDTPQQIEALVSRRGRSGPIGMMGIGLIKPKNDVSPVRLHFKLECEGPLPPISHQHILACSANKSPAEQTREIIGRLLPQAFRRPVTQDEIETIAKFADRAVANGQKWEVGMQHAMIAMLCSPKFLFRAELDDRPDSAESHPIGEFELASRLSYFLWSTMPDDELFKLAGEKKLSANLETQVRRMLKDPKSIALVDNFATQWLNLSQLQTHTPDAKLFPKFNNELRDAMLGETRSFLHYVIRENRSLLDLVDADYTFLNRRLGQHYGIADALGNRVGSTSAMKGDPLPKDQFIKVQLQGTERGGLLTHASILTMTSPPTRSSPVKRGAWVLENILGTPPPPPPPNVPELDQKEVKASALRERLEEHRANAVCASCHSKIDPLGFAFENYDAIGSFRKKEGNIDIDASGMLPDGQAINGMVDLKKALLTEKEKFVRHVAEIMLIYALGRGVEYYDKRAVDRIVSEAAKEDFKLSQMIIAIIESAPFRLRRGKDQSQ